MEGPAALLVQGLDFGPDLVKMGPDTGGAIAQAWRNYLVGAATMTAKAHDL
jgi:hypothetical protein